MKIHKHNLTKLITKKIRGITKLRMCTNTYIFTINYNQC